MSSHCWPPALGPLTHKPANRGYSKLCAGLANTRLAEGDGATSSHCYRRAHMVRICGETEEGPGEGISIPQTTNGY